MLLWWENEMVGSSIYWVTFGLWRLLVFPFRWGREAFFEGFEELERRGAGVKARRYIAGTDGDEGRGKRYWRSKKLVTSY